MNATADKQLADYARAALKTVKFFHDKCRNEIAAGRFIWQGPSLFPHVGDGVSVKVASCRLHREAAARAEADLACLLDEIVREEDVNKVVSLSRLGSSFSQLLERQRKEGFVPTIPDGRSPSLTVLADAYDYAAERQGLPLRVRRSVGIG